MNREALFCDGTEAYVSPPEPESGEIVQLWFRTAKDDVDKVYLQHNLGKRLFQRGILTIIRLDGGLGKRHSTIAL